MAGFLDLRAPTIDAEYGRYLDGDILGKFIFANFMRNRAGVPKSRLRVPIGRFGDVGSPWRCCADAQVRINGTWRNVEIKCARVNIANKTIGGTDENWAFGKILRTDEGVSRKYSLRFFVAVRVLGLEDAKYWRYLKRLEKEYRAKGIPFDRIARPHEAKFLSVCSFIIVPRSRLVDNQFRVMLSRLSTGKYSNYQAWGYEIKRCRLIWKSAVKGNKGVRRAMKE
jgi:hypothetical protein